MVRLRWRGHRGEGGEAAGTPDNGLRPDGSGTPMTGWAERASGGQARVPGWLQLTAGWAWRLLIVGVVIYLAFRLASALRLVVLPFIAALLLTALLQPLTGRLPEVRRSRDLVHPPVARSRRVADGRRTKYRPIPDARPRTRNTVHGTAITLLQSSLEQLSNRVLAFLKQHQSAVAGTVLSGGKIFLEILAGLVLMLFVTFFLLKDGDRIWSWLTGFLSAEGRRRVRGAGAAAWQALTYYVRGTIVVATIHAVVIGLALWVLGVPLLAPLVILVFLAAFVPLVGILVAGTLAVAVTLGTRGWVAAVVLVAIFILENQLESHLLQPLVVGRMVRLHPLAIILALAVGAAIAGIAGAVVAVPITAALVRAGPYLRGAGPGPLAADTDQAGQAPQRR
jgi:predicted PurR-regulated permease PerM